MRVCMFFIGYGPIATKLDTRIHLDSENVLVQSIKVKVNVKIRDFRGSKSTWANAVSVRDNGGTVGADSLSSEDGYYS